jgi:uncharacterized protein YwgA
MNEAEFGVDDLIVMLLGAPTKSPGLVNKVSGITRLEKLIFILDEETDVGQMLTDSPEFVPHNFGPFSQKVYQAIDILASANLVTDSAQIDVSNDESWETGNFIDDEPDQQYTSREISLTERGRRYYNALETEFGSNVVSTVSAVKDRFGNLPLTQLVRYVYQRHPEQIEKSIIRNKILGK